MVVHDQGVGEPVSWTWDEFRALPTETPAVDIHCVTRWSKLDTTWEGVTVDTLLEHVDHDASYALAFCDGGRTTNATLEDLVDGKAWVVFPPRVAVEVVAIRLPEAGLVVVEELETAHPFRALPEVEVRDEKPGRPAVLGVQRLAVEREQRYWGD